MKQILTSAFVFTMALFSASAYTAGGVDPLPAPEPAGLCFSLSPCPLGTYYANFVPGSKRCGPTIPPGCCQFKDYDYQCNPGDPMSRYTQMNWKSGGTCSGDTCL